MIKLFIISVLSLLLLTCACKSNRFIVNQLWVGSYYNKHLKLPLPVLLWFSKNGKASKKTSSGVESSFHWKIDGEKIQLDSIYKLNQLDRETLAFSSLTDSNDIFFYEFKRVRMKKSKNSICELKTALCSKIWLENEITKSGFEEQVVYKFTPEEVFLKRSYYYNGFLLRIEENESLNYEIVDFFDQLFIMYSNGSNGLVQHPVEPILSFDDKRLITENYNHVSSNYYNSSSREERVLLATDMLPDSLKFDSVNFFKTCNDFYVLESYQKQIVFCQQGEYYLNDYFKLKFKPSNDSQSGLITIRFTINCQGEIGRFKLYQLDQNYQPTFFDIEIIDQLVYLLKNIQGWENSIQKNRTLEKVDCYKHLNFKIKNGSLIEVFPAND